MRICAVELRGFRGVRSGTVTLPKHAVLMGANNAGKSTIVEALALLFSRDRMVDPISDWDFYGGAPSQASRFYVVATLVDFPDDSIESSPDWFLGEGKARPCWWHESTSALHLDADPPDNTKLATQIALAARYDEETCSFEAIRYFYYGTGDPFTDGCVPIPQSLLKEVGLFLLASNREWDRLLNFTSSSLLKVLRENDAIPGTTIESLKGQLRNNVEKVEYSQPLASILATAERELKSFSLIQNDSKIAYRPTSLDTFSVLRSLNAHIIKPDGSVLPVAKHGAGLVALQAFLLLLSFAEKRSANGKNFVLAAEEPELHLHPSLHQRLIHRIRGSSTQSLVTTQSPQVAASYQPTEVVFVQNVNGELTASQLRTDSVNAISQNSVRKLYRQFRQAYYESLMGGIVLIPEGASDFDWLLLFQRVAQSSPGTSSNFTILPMTVVPTSDAAVVETHKEIARFRKDAIPILDGDPDGDKYQKLLVSANDKPRKVVRFGKDAAIECLAAWVLEPLLISPTPTLLTIGCANWNLRTLQKELVARKDDREFREAIAWEALDNPNSYARVCEFFHDISAISIGTTRSNSGWLETMDQQSLIYTATHITRV